MMTMGERVQMLLPLLLLLRVAAVETAGAFAPALVDRRRRRSATVSNPSPIVCSKLLMPSALVIRAAAEDSDDNGAANDARSPSPLDSKNREAPKRRRTISRERRSQSPRPDLVRRPFFASRPAVAAAAAHAVLILSLACGCGFSALPKPAVAAPPIAVIAEELGYFPITSREGKVAYVPRTVRRHSTKQAVELAQHLRTKNVILAGAYWCPHTLRQRELLGREAAAMVEYVECAPRGYQADPNLCQALQVEGYPTWVYLVSTDDPPSGNNNGGGKRQQQQQQQQQQLAGERSLVEVAEFAGYNPGRPFNDRLEQQADPPPPLMGGGSEACRQQQQR